MASPCHNIHHLCYSITIIASTIANIITAIANTIAITMVKSRGKGI